MCAGIAAAEYIKVGHGHVNYNAIPSVVYTHPEVAWVGRTEQDLKADGVKYNIGKFNFSANSRAKTNLDMEGFVKFVTEKETDKILGVHIIGPNAGEMIADGVLAIDYGASAEDIARTTHAHVCSAFLLFSTWVLLLNPSFFLAHIIGSIQRSRYGLLQQTHPYVILLSCHMDMVIDFHLLAFLVRNDNKNIMRILIKIDTFRDILPLIKHL